MLIIGQIIIAISVLLLIASIVLCVIALKSENQPKRVIHESPNEARIRRSAQEFILTSTQVTKFGDKRRRTSHTTSFLA